MGYAVPCSKQVPPGDLGWQRDMEGGVFADTLVPEVGERGTTRAALRTQSVFALGWRKEECGSAEMWAVSD